MHRYRYSCITRELCCKAGAPNARGRPQQMSTFNRELPRTCKCTFKKLAKIACNHADLILERSVDTESLFTCLRDENIH